MRKRRKEGKRFENEYMLFKWKVRNTYLAHILLSPTTNALVVTLKERNGKQKQRERKSRLKAINYYLTYCVTFGMLKLK